ncbi:methyltransferase [Streptomyces fimicarius]|uniref:Methyltransferase n=2 Tax=Streptomyces TaxID=1883 RepID=A0AB33KL05_9ACTN|nr:MULTISPECIES: methyltransferase [Streptomyces]MCL6293263.1 methyltransferase [Streptomyces sp. 43Y-GA-1]MCX4710514.1 methyltransferase [Streptomyces griseus]MDX2670057.1 methyltransferase [Streptomyces sp. NRRL_ISP-5395]MDX3336975.1 methyltransferase [Streptomyces sp. ME02-6979.5a]MDX3500832.1 methyltransferase [Streptomyces sp. ATCC51928]
MSRPTDQADAATDGNGAYAAPAHDPVAERFMAMSDVITPNAVRVAATLGIADLVREGVDRLDDLAARTSTDREALGEMMRHLTVQGLFAQPEPGVYAPTELSRWIESDHPVGMREFLDLDSPMGRPQRAFAGLLHSIRTGGPAYAEIYGRTYWEDLDARPDLSRAFNAKMAKQVSEIAADVAKTYDWSGVGHVVDVGGGTGTLLAEVLAAHPSLRATLVDLPAASGGAGRLLAEAGVADRCEIVAGSFFEPLPAGADVYLLSTILHDWSDEASRAILRRCAEAAGEHGRVLVVEHLIQPEIRQGISTLNLILLTTLGGRERSLEEYAELADAADLRVLRTLPLPSGRSAVELGAVLPITAEHDTP